MTYTSFKIGDITNKVSFNSPCTGIIQKSHPRNNFVRFHYNSKMAEWVFSDYPRLVEQKWKWAERTCDKIYADKIVVLQAMVFGNNEFLVEYVYEKDLNNEENVQK